MTWVDASTPEGFRSVDVPEAGDELLIEQRGLDRAAARSKRDTELFGRPRRIRRVGAETQLQCGTGGMDVERAEGARIDEHETRAISELEHGASEARQWCSDVSPLPVPIHAKMDMDDAPVIEMKELVLAASLDANDARARERPKHSRRHTPPERWMNEAESRDHATLRATTQLLDGSLHFR